MILHVPQCFLIHVPPIYRYTNLLDTSFHILVSSLHGCSVHSYILFVYHCYMYSLVYMHVLFLYSCHVDHRSYCMYYCCMYLPVFPLHKYSRYWIHELLICDVWNPTSIVSRFPLSCFMLSTELISCYHVICTMYYTCTC